MRNIHLMIPKPIEQEDIFKIINLAKKEGINLLTDNFKICKNNQIMKLNVPVNEVMLSVAMDGYEIAIFDGYPEDNLSNQVD